MDIRRAKLHATLLSMGASALGFSGGTDSSYLLREAVECGADVRPYFVDTCFNHSGDLERAVSFCRNLDVQLEVVPLDIMSEPCVQSNGPDRCYWCKMAIFSHVRERAHASGRRAVVDGTNASDLESERPGMRAIRELGVRSPLRECGISKDDVRELSRELGLPTWDTPSDSCLATRVLTGVRLTPDILSRVDSAESQLRGMGFSGFRVRTDGRSASIVFRRSQRVEAEDRWDDIESALSGYFDHVSMDEEVRD